jgi:hypothetical protein
VKPAGAVATIALFSVVACSSSSNPRADATPLSDECAAAVRARPTDRRLDVTGLTLDSLIQRLSN